MAQPQGQGYLPDDLSANVARGGRAGGSVSVAAVTAKGGRHEAQLSRSAISYRRWMKTKEKAAKRGASVRVPTPKLVPTLGTIYCLPSVSVSRAVSGAVSGPVSGPVSVSVLRSVCAAHTNVSLVRSRYQATASHASERSIKKVPTRGLSTCSSALRAERFPQRAT